MGMNAVITYNHLTPRRLFEVIPHRFLNSVDLHAAHAGLNVFLRTQPVENLHSIFFAAFADEPTG